MTYTIIIGNTSNHFVTILPIAYSPRELNEKIVDRD